MHHIIATIFYFLLLDSTVQAAEFVETNTSVRALGMGNAYTAVVRDKDSLFYNPAGLAYVSGINLTIMDPRFGADGYDVIQTVVNAQQGSGGISNTLRQLFGKNIWVGGGAKTALTIPGFGVALYDSAEVAANMSNPAFPDLNLRYLNDYGFVVGGAFDVVPKFLSFGVTGSRITRYGGAFPIGLSTLGTLSNQNLLNQLSNQGTGYAIDTGLILTVPSPVSPTFSFVWKNVGSTTFTRETGNQAPPRIQDEMIAGMALLIDLPGLNITPAFDIKHINSPDEQLGKKVHVGIEFDFPFLKARGGFHQGYWTLGAGVDMTFIKLDAATYGVELGEYPGQKEDRRYLLQLTMELGFDPSLGLFKGGGKGGSGRPSGVKQRR